MSGDPVNREVPRWWEGLLCGVAVVVAVCAARPYAEMGFIDDWSYVKTAFEYARTGHFVYNGWATAMLGWQIPWGALFLKLFGYSFTAARLSMLPVDLLSVWLFYSILMRFGIERRNAVFGTLTLGLSPLFVPLGASYMTDVPGLFVILLCLYLCLRALDAEDDRAALLWLVLGAASNVAGGTVRQIAWLGALVMVPSAAWLMRRRRHALLAGAVLWLASAAAIFACLQWWSRQPYSVPEKIVQGPVSAFMVAHLGAELLKALLCTCLLAFPVLVAWLPRYRMLPRRTRIALAMLLVALSVGAYALHLRGTLEHRVAPWIGHVIGTEGLFSSTGEMLGTRPVTANLFWRTVLSLVVIASAAVCFLDSWSNQRQEPTPAAAKHGRVRIAAYLLVPFSVSYCCLLISRGLYSFVYDRYLLGILPGALVLVLLLYQHRVRKLLPRWTFAILACLSLYVVAATHDWFALNRARVQAVAILQAAGIPKTQIQGGFDFDGWTQLENAPSVNWAAIRNPPNAYHAYPPETGLAPPCRLDFAPYTPSIRPDYFLTFQLMPCLAPSQFGPIAYRTWNPPHTRFVYIQRRPR